MKLFVLCTGLSVMESVTPGSVSPGHQRWLVSLSVCLSISLSVASVMNETSGVEKSCFQGS